MIEYAVFFCVTFLIG